MVVDARTLDPANIDVIATHVPSPVDYLPQVLDDDFRKKIDISGDNHIQQEHRKPLHDLLETGKEHLRKAQTIAESDKVPLPYLDRKDFEATKNNLERTQVKIEKQMDSVLIKNPMLSWLPGKKRLLLKAQAFEEEAWTLLRNVFEKSKVAANEKRRSDQDNLKTTLTSYLESQKSSGSSSATIINDIVEKAVIKLKGLREMDEATWAKERGISHQKGLELCSYCGVTQFRHVTKLVPWRSEIPQPVCIDPCLLIIDLPKLLSAKEEENIRRSLPDSDLLVMIQRAILSFHYNEMEPPPNLMVNLLSYRDQISQIVNVISTLIKHPAIFNEKPYRSLRSSLRRLLSKVIATFREQAGRYIYPEDYIFEPVHWKWVTGHFPEGKGSHGVVYTATHPRWEPDLIAVKVPLDDPEVPDQRMVYEFLIQWSLKHRNVLELYGTAIFLNDSEPRAGKPRHSLLMPLKSNGNVRKYLKNHIERMHDEPLNLQVADLSKLKGRVHNWIIGIVTGLAYLHGENIVHGDLRGVNIIVDNDHDTPLLTDFGLSVFADGTSGNHDSLRGGNECWQPLEILIGQNKVRAEKSTDIYFLGGLLVELYTGHGPYYLGPATLEERPNSLYPTRETIANYLSQNPPKLPDRPRFHSNDPAHIMHDDLWNLMQECWRTNKNDRPSVEDILRRIPGVIQRIGSS
ncbi:EKC/KEOPS complex subunit BUD32 [Abortiporus biennis]